MKYRLTGSYAFKSGENNGFFVWIFSKWIIHFINLLQKQYWKLMSISTVRKMKNEIASGFMNLIPVLRHKIAIQHIFEARFTISRFYILKFFYFRFSLKLPLANNFWNNQNLQKICIFRTLWQPSANHWWRENSNIWKSTKCKKWRKHRCEFRRFEFPAFFTGLAHNIESVGNLNKYS